MHSAFLKCGLQRCEAAGTTAWWDACARTKWRMLAHDPEKWIPVFGKDHAQTNNWRDSVIGTLRLFVLGLCLALSGTVIRRRSVSDARGAPDRRLSGRRADRHRGAHRGAVAVGTARPADRRREPAGRRQQHRDAGRHHSPPDGYTLLLVVSAARHQRDALQEAAVQFPRRHRAGRRPRGRAERAWRCIPPCRRKPSPSSSPTPRPTRARSASPPPATARPSISRASCSWR